MTETMLGKAARAAAMADVPEASYADIVRAALMAIREPSEAQINAAWRQEDRPSAWDYTAMIDAILSEGEA